MNSQALADFLANELEAQKVNLVRERRVAAEIPVAKLTEAIEALKENGLNKISAITGLDLGDGFEVIYHLCNDEGVLLSLKTLLARENPCVPSVTDLFPGVFLYERELIDLLGIKVEGTPHGRRYPLPEDWPEGEYPLRKDWNGLSKE